MLANMNKKMKKIILQGYNFIGKKYLSPILKLEQKKRPFPVINERATEYSFALKHMQELCTGKVLDIGSGKSSWPHLLSTCGFVVKAIDKMDDYWNSYFNRHYKIDNDDITNPKTKEKFQFATCLSVLEHIPDHRVAMINIHDLLETNGYLVLTFPYNENGYYEDIYKHPDAGYGQDANFITQVFSREEINCWLSDTSIEIIDQKFYKAFTGDVWTMGDRVTPCEQTTSSDLHHLTCILFQKKGN
jgi:SAM-dependent methyltransferase